MSDARIDRLEARLARIEQAIFRIEEQLAATPLPLQHGAGAHDCRRGR
jgi:hypothetical protein